MKQVVGDIWEYLPTHAIVVPVNVGWTRAGRNVMGRGVALQAARRWPELPAIYGEACRVAGAEMTVMSWQAPYGKYWLVLFPVKPLNERAPWLSWRGPATLEMIERSADDLANLAFAWGGRDGWPIALPLVGCGNGGLREEDVLPILERHLAGDQFLLVRLP